MFEDLFAGNKALIKDFNEFENGGKSGSNTQFFYTEIASKYIDAVQSKIEYTYLDLNEYKDLIGSTEKSDRTKLIILYKLFSKPHLLKAPFQNDSNKLNDDFYTELLYILGLEEQKQKKNDNSNSDGGKTLIVRKKQNERQPGALIENTITKLEGNGSLDNIKNLADYGETKDEQLFSIALELCITWLNRILFIKLLDAQLGKYQENNSYSKFFNKDTIRGFDELNMLFFQVLAIKADSRNSQNPTVQKLLGVPYLNSSLFEKNELESNTIQIGDLNSSEGYHIPIYNHSVLKKAHHNADDYKKPLAPLDYIFEFLDAYDFSSEGEETVQTQTKTLINASVLGLIFEKINGYKDGSVYTPGYITMFICRETIRREVLNKFNQKYNWQCANLSELYNKLDTSRLDEYNDLFNSIRICDPAVGSGHFLVAALNELVYLKFELELLRDKDGKVIKKSSYNMAIENDELLITDSDGVLFNYNKKNPESQRIQETLFGEKKRIIENCLFGVDINPNSVRICQLRLWIELLKNAYYTEESDYSELQTLPNIDINIKCANSLLYYTPLGKSIEELFNEEKITAKEVAQTIYDYKNTDNKKDKRKLDEKIEGLNKRLKDSIISSLEKDLKREIDEIKGRILISQKSFIPI